MLSTALKKIKNNDSTFIVIKDNKIVHEDKGIGVSCIRKVLNSNPSLLNDSIIVDKIIGKAAAMLLIPNKIKEVHSLVMSTSAIKILNNYNITNTAVQTVDVISNRTNTGMCPLEESVFNIEDFNEAHIAIEKKIEYLMSLK